MNKIMKNKLHYIAVILLLAAFAGGELKSQDTQKLSFDQVLKLAAEQSPNALIAKHRFRSSYWQYRTFIAEYRPALTLSGTLPDYNRIYEKEYDYQTGQESYVEKNTNNAALSMALSQNVGLTGGSFYVQSDLTRFDVLGTNGSTQYVTAPVSIGFSQPLFRYNNLKWQKRIEPLKYEEARKTYLEAVENVHLMAVQYFFNLALAQINMEIADMNYSNADTLYRIAQGRYNLGTIAEDELLQMELTFLNAGTSKNNASINLRDRELKLRSFLGYNENVRLELLIPNEIPGMEVEVNKVLTLAQENSPQMITLQRQIMEARSEVARAKSEKGFNANLTASYGLRQQAPLLPDSYRDPSDQQRVRIGFTMPILDWGLGRGRYKMAQSGQELAEVQVQQAMIDFEQNLLLDVAQFNQQDDNVRIAAKADTVAQKMYEVTKQRFLIGRIDVLELNNADTKKDQNKRAYIQSLQDYWTYFFNIRSITLYDFINDKPLESDYEKLIK